MNRKTRRTARAIEQRILAARARQQYEGRETRYLAEHKAAMAEAREKVQAWLAEQKAAGRQVTGFPRRLMGAYLQSVRQRALALAMRGA